MAPLSVEEARQLTYAAILKQLTEGVIVTDAVGTITFVNTAAADIHGVARLDVKPNAYSETYHLYREDGRHYPSDELPLARAVRGETVKDARWRIRRPDGRDVLAIGTAQPLRASDGRRIGAVLTLRDATAQDTAERSLQKSETALHNAEQRLADRDHIGGTATETSARQASVDRFISPLRDIAAAAQSIGQSASLEEAHRRGEQVRSIATALLALIGRPDGTPEPMARRPKPAAKTVLD